MARVCGNSEEAHKLADGLGVASQAIETALSDCKAANNKIKEAWDDSGYEVVDELISTVESAMKKAAESIPNLKKAVESYAAFLESSGR